MQPLTRVRAQVELSAAQARRIAIAAQALDQPLPARADLRHVRAAIRRIGLLQLDYVNVITPAHYQVLYTRIGHYDRSRFEEVVYARGEFTEQWAHEASVVPVDLWPLLQYRRDRHEARSSGLAEALANDRGYIERVLQTVTREGALSADALPGPEGGTRHLPESWHGNVPRAVLEFLFGRGELAVANRKKNFQRVFDLSARLIPADIHEKRVDEAAARRRLLRIAAAGRGVGTAADLADYFRMPVRTTRASLQELVDDGSLTVAKVEGWREEAYLDPASRDPGQISVSRLLCPFDPLLWHRPRVRRVFDFDYRVEIFFPKAKRRWGFYVLPFLFGDRLAARVDLRADRAAETLCIPGAWLEEGADRSAVAAALAGELAAFCRWLGMRTIRVGRRGNLARALATELRAVVV